MIEMDTTPGRGRRSSGLRPRAHGQDASPSEAFKAAAAAPGNLIQIHGFGIRNSVGESHPSDSDASLRWLFLCICVCVIQPC